MENTKNFLITLLICVVVQLVLFIPFIFTWKRDCREIGKDKLAVPLGDRFMAWLLCFPFWAIPFIIYFDK